MDNYAIMRQDAVDRFLTYEVENLLKNPGVTVWEKGVQTTFFSLPVHLDRTEGRIVLMIPGEKFSMSDALTRYLVDKCPQVELDMDLIDFVCCLLIRRLLEMCCCSRQ